MKKIIITTDCVSDMPKTLIEQYDIDIMYYYIHTEEGRFKDTDEISSDNLIEYIENYGKKAYSNPASVEEYYNFFKEKTKYGVPIIHICMAKYSSDGFNIASEAAIKLPNVYIFDSGNISGGMAIMALFAANMVKKGAKVSEILDKLTELKNKVSYSFIINSVEQLYKNEKISSNINQICSLLLLHPVLIFKDGKILLKKFYFGNLKRYYKRYIKGELKGRNDIDTKILFVNFVGCSLQIQSLILNEVKKYQSFDEIVTNKSSATISCNCGSGTFGLAYIKK